VSWAKRLDPLWPLASIASFAEVGSRAGWWEAYLFPAPSMVVACLWEDRAEFGGAFAETLFAASLGWGIALAAGTLLALTLSLSDRVERAFRPYAVFFQTVPVVAIAPLLVIWFGFGRPTVVAAAAIVSVFPVLAAGFAGLRSASAALTDYFRLRRAGRLATLFKLRIPSAVPQLLTGARIAAGLAVIGAVVGEFVGGGGLGGVVDAATAQQRVDKVFAAVLLSTLLGFGLVSIVDAARERLLSRWLRS